MLLVRTVLDELHAWQWLGILIARLAVGLLFFLSGRGKLFVPERREQMRETLVAAHVPFPELNALFVSTDSFSGKRNEIGGRKVSLDDIEHGALRPLIGYRTHAVLVCAARSCPPLQRFAYAGDKFEEQNDRAYQAWLARADLNKFLPNERKVEFSSIFKWFKQDFDKAGGVRKILGQYAPQSVREFAAGGKYDTKYVPYDWGLNDQGRHGRNYSRAHLLFDNIFK